MMFGVAKRAPSLVDESGVHFDFATLVYGKKLVDYDVSYMNTRVLPFVISYYARQLSTLWVSVNFTQTRASS